MKFLDLPVVHANGKDAPPLVSDKRSAIAAAIASGEVTPAAVLAKQATLARKTDALRNELESLVDPAPALPIGPEALENEGSSSDEEALVGLDGDPSSLLL